MSRRTFLLQGFTPRTHLKELKSSLALRRLSRVLLSVAFVTRGGVELVAPQLTKPHARVDAFVGIRNDITTREGLHALLKTGANVHCVDTGARNLVFHPKIYLCCSKSKARAIIGSANLTAGGLNNNIESSVVLDFDLGCDEDSVFVESVFAEFARLPSDYESHVLRIQGPSDLDDLRAEGRLVDEATSSPPRGAGGAQGKVGVLPPIELKVKRVASPVRRPQRGKGKPRRPRGSGPATPGSSSPVTLELELVWRSKSLTPRDLGLPSGSKTHPTGSINLDKGLLDKDVDHRHFFRDEVFSTLNWVSRSSTVDEAYAEFGLIVAGVTRGEFNLRVAHTTSTETRSYLQGNAMTRLSWGPMKPFVSRPDLIGRTLSLYRDRSDSTRFVVEID